MDEYLIWYDSLKIRVTESRLVLIISSVVFVMVYYGKKNNAKGFLLLEIEVGLGDI